MSTPIARREALRAGLLLAGAALFAGCASPLVKAGPPLHDEEPVDAGTPAPAGVPAPDGALAGIQETLHRQAAARVAGDREAYMATIDQRNLTWRRIQREMFASEARRSGETYTVTRVAPKMLDYVKAWIDVTPPGAPAPTSQVVWVFRRTDDGWLHSEVLNEEIGSRKTVETDHFAVSYYAWDDDVIDRVVEIAELAWARVTERTGIVPEGRTRLSVNPTFASHSALRGADALALYMPGQNTIVVRSLESYGAGRSRPAETQEDRLFQVLVHEYAHRVTDHVVSTVKLPGWMNEGFAEYVAENLRPGTMAQAMRSGRLISLQKASDIIEWWTDPARGYSGADFDLAYAHSANGVAYFIERFGQDAFFELARRYGDSRQWEASVAAVLGVDWAQFEQDWLVWLRARYGG